MRKMKLRPSSDLVNPCLWKEDYARLIRDAATLRLIVKHRLTVMKWAHGWPDSAWKASQCGGHIGFARSIHTAVRRAAKGVSK